MSRRTRDAVVRLQHDAEREADLARAGKLLDLARRMIERGADLDEVQRVLGHSNIAITRH